MGPGLRPAGFSPDRCPPRGPAPTIFPRGFMHRGVSPQSFCPLGSSPHGFSAPRLSPEIPPRGVRPRGVLPRRFMPRGVFTPSPPPPDHSPPRGFPPRVLPRWVSPYRSPRDENPNSATPTPPVASHNHPSGGCRIRKKPQTDNGGRDAHALVRLPRYHARSESGQDGRGPPSSFK